MRAYTPRRRPRSLRGLIVAATLLLSVFFLAPALIHKASALSPAFSRPNVKIDAGAGPIGSQIGGGPSVALGAGGVLHAVWSDGRSGTDKGIYYAKSMNNGATWIAEQRIDGAGGIGNVAPSITTDTTGGAYSGSIYVVWQKGEGNAADVLFIKSVDDGLTWINRYRIDTAPLNVPSAFPRVAVDGSGTIYVAFMDARKGDQDIFMATSSTGGFGWSSDEPLSTSTDFDEYPALSASGTIVAVAWQVTNSTAVNLLVAVSNDNGLNWRNNTVISIPLGTGGAFRVSIAIDDSAHLHASWTSLDQFGTYSISYSRSDDGGVTWTYPVKVDDNAPSPTFAPYSSVVLCTATAIYVIWADNRNTDYDMFASWSENGGVTWGDFTPGNDIRVDDTDDNAPTTDDSTEQTAPSAAASQFGIFVAWADSRDNIAMHAYLASFESGTLIVTEIRDSPDGLERIEVFNRGPSAIDVTGWFIDIDGTSNFISPLGLVPSLQYRTIGDEVTSDLPLGITLNDEGGAIRIFDQTGSLRELVAYGQKGIAPDPLPSESVGRVLRGGAYTRYWTRTPAPSFGSQNSVPMPNTNSSLVLNEVLYSATVPDKRFIELIYKGNGSLSLAGYNIVGDVTYPIPATTIDAANNFLLIFPVQAPTLFASTDLAGDNLYLYDSAGLLLDMVGWTTAHTIDASVCRIPDGFGYPEGFDDMSSVTSGWRFDCSPTPHLVGIDPPGTIFANLGDLIFHDVHVTNYMNTPTVVDLMWNAPPAGWAVSMIASDHFTPLPDTNLNGWPDVSLDSYGTPGQTVNIAVRVSTPANIPQNDTVVTTVVAQAQPEGRDSVDLTTGFFPYLAANRSAKPTTVYVRGTGYGEESTVTLELQGRGMKLPGRGPDALDVVFVIDDTGSMATWIGAVKTDVDWITESLFANITDVRFGLVSYKDVPNIDVDQDLTPDTAQFKAALFALTASGGGDLPEDPDVALETSANLSWRLGATPKVMILIGDAPAHDNNHLAMVARWAYNVLNIHTNTIGCGNDVNMANAFAAAALEGHGYFIQLGNPSAMADAIISGIMAVVPAIDYVAQDRDLSDGNPMVRDALPPYITYTPGTFVDPVTKTPRPPEYISTDISGNTIFDWNVSVLKINKTWSVQFNITSSLTGLVVTNVLGLSRVSFTNWSGSNVTIDFPMVWITVLPAPPLPDLALSPSDIAFYPPAPYLELHPMSVNATIHNLGQSSSDATDVRFYDGMPPAPTIGGDQPLAPVPMLGAGSASVPWTPTVVGTHLICIEVDPANLVREMNESNNNACTSIYVQPTRPDYLPNLPQPPTDFKAGMSLMVNLSIMVFNQGNRSAPSSSTLAFMNQTGLPFQYYTVPAIAEQDVSSTFTARWKSPPNPGTFAVLAMVDYYDTVAEWDEANNIFAWAVQVVNGPRTTLVIGSPNHTSSRTFITSAAPLNFSVEDRGGTGISRTMYSVDYRQWTVMAPGGSFHLSGDGEHSIRWYSEDNVGNREGENSRMLVVDDTPPSTTLAVGNPKYVGSGTWVTSLTRMSLTALDSGVLPVGPGTTHYRIWDGIWGAWSSYSSPFNLGSGDGPRQIEFFTEDLLGNVEVSRTAAMVVDDSPPAIILEPLGNSFAIGTAFSLRTDDGAGSGVALVWVGVDGGNYSFYTGPFALGLGPHRIFYKSVDRLGNPSESSRLVDVVDLDTNSLSVSYNYKPTVALVFSALLLLMAAFSARRRPMKYGKNLRRRFALSLAVLPLPFLIAEAATGLLSVSYEFMRIPPLLGWGMAVDTAVLLSGTLFLFLRLLIGRKGVKGEAAADEDLREDDGDWIPPPPED